MLKNILHMERAVESPLNGSIFHRMICHLGTTEGRGGGLSALLGTLSLFLSCETTILCDQVEMQ